jgi:hypothetical protein
MLFDIELLVGPFFVYNIILYVENNIFMDVLSEATYNIV